MRWTVLLILLWINYPTLLSQNYTFNQEEEHFVLLLQNEAFSIPYESAAELAKYNAQKQSEKQLEIKRYSIPFLSSLSILFVKSFPSAKESAQYVKRLQKDLPSIMTNDIIESVWTISASNFQLLLKRKDKAEYHEFMKKNYDIITKN